MKPNNIFFFTIIFCLLLELTFAFILINKSKALELTQVTQCTEFAKGEQLLFLSCIEEEMKNDNSPIQSNSDNDDNQVFIDDGY